MKQIQKTLTVSGRTLTLSQGKLATKAESAVLAQMGDTVVLATLCSKPLKEDIGYFPLSVDFEERHYAGGRISSSRFIKREGRPSENAIISGRAIDRAIRPLFPKNVNREVQIIVTVLSLDKENDPALLGFIAVCAAVEASTIPWNGPVAPAKVALLDDELVVFPTDPQLAAADLDLLVAAKDDGITMLEGEGVEVSEKVFKEALQKGFDAAQPILKLITDFGKEAGKPKIALVQEDDAVKSQKTRLGEYIRENFLPQLEDVEFVKSLEYEWHDRCIEELKQKFADDQVESGVFVEAFDDEFRNFVRSRILDTGKRVDGRSMDQIRDLAIEVGVLPRTHGSALFQRGVTQALTIATLGSSSLEQTVENMEGEYTKRYMHYYNMPPFASGEVKRMGSTGRREIGHGLLAEKALVPVLPTEEDFPYAMRLVSEILSSAGSTSQASICASSLALMDAGVPIKTAVAGIAMGFVTSEDWDTKGKGKYEIVTDIAYTEDANGDMDFKLAGTKEGMTAIQMDIKLPSVPVKILQEITDKAVSARHTILDAMDKVIAQPRSALSQYAPRITSVQIDPEKIGQVIGGGGKVINKIIDETGAELDIKEDGRVLISGTPEQTEAAKLMVEAIVHEFQPGEIFDGTVTRIMNFGAFVEVMPGREGLVHISQLAPERTENVEDLVSVGQKLKVRVVEVDREGRLNLSARFGNDADDRPRERFDDRGGRGGGRGYDRGGSRGGGRGDRGRGGFRR